MPASGGEIRSLFLHVHERSLPGQNPESSGRVGWREGDAGAGDGGGGHGDDGDEGASPPPARSSSGGYSDPAFQNVSQVTSPLPNSRHGLHSHPEHKPEVLVMASKPPHSNL